MANISISSKSTKTEIMTFLRDTSKEVVKLDKTLADSINYASDKIKKDPKSVTRADLWDLAQKVMQITGVTPKPVEMSSKLGNKSFPLASIFPPELVLNNNIFVAVPYKYQTMDEIRKAVRKKEDGGEDKTLMFAAYWTPRLIRQFDYVGTYKLEKKTNEDVINLFEKDVDALDIAVLDTEDTIIAISAYTEAVYLFKGEDLKAVEDTDSDGNKYVLRFSNGMEFQIYELVDDDTDNEASEKAEESEEEDKEASEKEEEKEPQQSKDEKTTGRKKKFSSKNKKTSDIDNDTEDKDNSVNTAE